MHADRALRISTEDFHRLLVPRAGEDDRGGQRHSRRRELRESEVLDVVHPDVVHAQEKLMARWRLRRGRRRDNEGCREKKGEIAKASSHSCRIEWCRVASGGRRAPGQAASMSADCREERVPSALGERIRNVSSGTACHSDACAP